MAVYVYRCSSGHELEKEFPIGTAGNYHVLCMECTEDPVISALLESADWDVVNATLDDIEMRRVISAPAVHFKGSGWASKE